MLGDVNKLFVFKSLLTMPSNVLPLHLKQTFPPIIWIFTEGEGDGIKSRLPFEIFSTLHYYTKRKSFELFTVSRNMNFLIIKFLNVWLNFYFAIGYWIGKGPSINNGVSKSTIFDPFSPLLLVVNRQCLTPPPLSRRHSLWTTPKLFYLDP